MIKYHINLMEINPDKLIFAFNECVQEQVTQLITRICEQENLNFVEIAEKYGLLKNNRKDYKPKKKRELKIPEPCLRCEAMSAEGEQCKRSKKDESKYCRRHKYRQNYGTIHNNIFKQVDNMNDVVEKTEDIPEIESNGNIITLENGQEVIHIPSTGLCYSYCNHPELIGTLSPDFKTIITDETNNLGF